MVSWFNKKKAPDGTNIVQHENIETKFGVTKGTDGFGQAREAVYATTFRNARQRFPRSISTGSSHRRVHLQAITGG